MCGSLVCCLLVLQILSIVGHCGQSHAGAARKPEASGGERKKRLHHGPTGPVTRSLTMCALLWCVPIFVYLVLRGLVIFRVG